MTQEDAHNSQVFSTAKLTQEKLKEILGYDSTTGIFRWKKRMAQCIHVGDIAGGGATTSRYIQIQIRGYHYMAHRLAWLYMYGVWPSIIDHIDGLTGNNAINNLRECSHSQNAANRSVMMTNMLGVKGVTQWKGRYRAQININGRHTSLGTFDTIEEAAETYLEAAKRHFGDFARG